MSTTVPSVSGDQEVVADAVLARGNLSARGTIDLRSKIGAFLFASIGRGGATALDLSVSVEIRPTLGNDDKLHPNSAFSRLSSLAAANVTAVNNTSNSGQNTLNVASTTEFSVGDIICIQDSDAGFTRLEWAKISKIAAGTPGDLILQNALRFTHTTGDADTVRNEADCFPAIWLPGGQLYEAIFDYGGATTGEAVTIRARTNQVDNYTSAT